MTDASVTRYARSGDIHIAYRVEGSGPPDIVIVPNWATDVEASPLVPLFRRSFEYISSYARLVYFDQLGTGHSDPLPRGEMPTLETFADSTRIVMDDAGIDRAAIISMDLGTPAAILFAATHPQRTTHLVLQGTARILADEGYPGLPLDSVDAYVEEIGSIWGTQPYLERFFPDVAKDKEASEQWLWANRHGMSPGMVRRVLRMAIEQDVRALLPSVSAPTLVFPRPNVSFQQSRYLADHIPNARLWVTPKDMTAREAEAAEGVGMQEFLTGRRPLPPADNRVLATVLFTDMVSSTERAATMGDGEWSLLLDRHNQIVDRCIADFRGRHIDSTGDGVLVTFDGPARAIRCACAIRDTLKPLSIDVRAGLHTGEIELAGDDVRGIAVHIAARVMAQAGAGEVVVSSTVKDLVAGSGIVFADRGTHALKGVPDEWRLFSVEG